MAGNTFGTLFRLTTFGESHGAAIGGILDGCPPGLTLDLPALQREMDRRRPGQSALTSPRNEGDVLEILSGTFKGVTTGAPIAFQVRNTNQRPADYDAIAQAYRPGHADYTYEAKYGLRDHRGGGRSSARETAARVAAGAIAKQMLATKGIMIQAYVASVYDIEVPLPYTSLDLTLTESTPVRCPHLPTAARMIAAIEAARTEGDTLGGTIVCVATGVPPGLGEPVFDKLHAELGKAMLSINAVKGFEIGDGFAATLHKGSQNNDAFVPAQSGIAMATNHAGGVLGGISNGADVWCRVAFKPIASIGLPQTTVNLAGEATEIAIMGRHDPCVLPRAVPIVEAMAALVLADMLLRARASGPLMQ